ncbi:MAG: ATP-binding protein, partial [Gammaproteobacteria bacterium]
STKSFGTGLGIPIAFKICQKHGWNLSFDSSEQEGTKVMITAPIRVIEEDD